MKPSSSQDAKCVCRFGVCEIEGTYFGLPLPEPECTTYEDCDCRSPGRCSKAKKPIKFSTPGTPLTLATAMETLANV